MNLVQLLRFCVLACTFLAHRRLSQTWGYPPVSPTGCTLDGPLEPYHTSFAVPPLEAKSLNAYSAVFSNSARTLPATTGPKLSVRGPAVCLFLHFPALAPATVGGALARGEGGNPFTLALAKERERVLRLACKSRPLSLGPWPLALRGGLLRAVQFHSLPPGPGRPGPELTYLAAVDVFPRPTV